MRKAFKDQYAPEDGPEYGGQGIKNKEPLEVGRGVKKPSLHGDHTIENKKEGSAAMFNEVNLGDDMALEIRKAVTLDYIEGGGDGKGDNVADRITAFKKNNSEWIDHAEVDELYPTSDRYKGDGDKASNTSREYSEKY